MHRYSVMYQDRRLSSIREIVRVVAPDPHIAATKADSVMERNGFRLRSYRRPRIRRDL